MEQKINIDNLDDLQKQALVCMYYAMLPKTDARYKQRMHDWEVLEKRFGTKKTTYKHAKDAFDFYFPNNGRKGWSDDRDLKRRGHAYQEVFELYKDYSADQLEKAVAEIIHGYENEEPTFVSMKCGFPDTVHNILNGNKDITVDGVYKIIMYLFEDAAKQRRHMLFEGCDEDIRNQYSAICEEFDKRGIDIFCKEIRDKIKKEYLSELE